MLVIASGATRSPPIQCPPTHHRPTSGSDRRRRPPAILISHRKNTIVLQLTPHKISSVTSNYSIRQNEITLESSGGDKTDTSTTGTNEVGDQAVVDKTPVVGCGCRGESRAVEVAVAAAVTVILGVGNRVLYKLALVPLKQYPFFLAQLATFGFVKSLSTISN